MFQPCSEFGTIWFSPPIELVTSTTPMLELSFEGSDSMDTRTLTYFGFRDADKVSNKTLHQALHQKQKLLFVYPKSVEQLNSISSALNSDMFEDFTAIFRP